MRYAQRRIGYDFSRLEMQGRNLSSMDQHCKDRGVVENDY